MAATLCPSRGEWIDDLWSIHTTECVMAVKMKVLQLYSTTWANLTNNSWDKNIHAVGTHRWPNSISKACKTRQYILQDCICLWENYKDKGKGTVSTKFRALTAFGWEGEEGFEEDAGKLQEFVMSALLSWIYEFIIVINSSQVIYVKMLLISKGKCTHTLATTRMVWTPDPKGRNWRGETCREAGTSLGTFEC